MLPRRSDIRTVAVIGANVAGATVANLLAGAGRTVFMFDKTSLVDPRVGESLLPSAVPVLRRLLPEEEIECISLLKPGLSFVLQNGRRLTFEMKILKASRTPIRTTCRARNSTTCCGTPRRAGASA
ncbi:hypothetical protein [Bradyrhizobium sp. BR 1432]|uniref:hypothetical protein n=1 Tax=Bradyrhizobium sp. BR 1432 TaxID=3447966 RepID=UPI003EE4EAFC